MSRKNTIWTCSECGSESVSQAVWINPNKPVYPYDHPGTDDEVYQVEGDYGVNTDGYCNECEKEVPLKCEELD